MFMCQDHFNYYAYSFTSLIVYFSDFIKQYDFSSLSLDTLKLEKYRYAFINVIICTSMIIGIYENTEIDAFHKVRIVTIISFVLFLSRN